MLLRLSSFHTWHGRVIPFVVMMSWVCILLYGYAAPNIRPATSEPSRKLLYRINADGSALRLLRDDPNISFWGPVWSPTGTQICVTFGSLDGSKGELYLLDADGQHLRQITQNERN